MVAAATAAAVDDASTSRAKPTHPAAATAAKCEGIRELLLAVVVVVAVLQVAACFRAVV